MTQDNKAYSIKIKDFNTPESEKSCDNCGYFRMQEEILGLKKDKKLRKELGFSKKHLTGKRIKIGKVCFTCVRNEIDGKIGWAYARLPQTYFQTFDRWIPWRMEGDLHDIK